jgi:hypothetical protein
LDVPENFLGKQVRCATCSTVFDAKAEGQPNPQAGAPKSLDVDQAKPLTPDRPPQRERDWDSDADRPPEDDYYEDDEHRRRFRRDSLPHRGGLILGLGIASIVICVLGCGCNGIPALIGIPLGVAAWIMGRNDIRQMSQGMMDADGRGLTQGGHICGIIGVVFGILAIIFWVAYLIVLFAFIIPAGGGGF